MITLRLKDSSSFVPGCREKGIEAIYIVFSLASSGREIVGILLFSMSVLRKGHRPTPDVFGAR
jgi:hypothetical protein